MIFDYKCKGGDYFVSINTERNTKVFFTAKPINGDEYISVYEMDVYIYKDEKDIINERVFHEMHSKAINSQKWIPRFEECSPGEIEREIEKQDAVLKKYFDLFNKNIKNFMEDNKDLFCFSLSGNCSLLYNSEKLEKSLLIAFSSEKTERFKRFSISILKPVSARNFTIFVNHCKSIYRKQALGLLDFIDEINAFDERVKGQRDVFFSEVKYNSEINEKAFSDNSNKKEKAKRAKRKKDESQLKLL